MFRLIKSNDPLPIHDAIKSENYRKLKSLLQETAPAKVRALVNQTIHGKSLLYIACEAWIATHRQCFENNLRDPNLKIYQQLAEQVDIARILVAYGASDEKAFDLIFRGYQLEIMNSKKDPNQRCYFINDTAHSIGNYVGKGNDSQRQSHAIMATISTFRTLVDLEKYYLFIMNYLIPGRFIKFLGTGRLDNEELESIKSAYESAKIQIKIMNSENYVDEIENAIAKPESNMQRIEDYSGVNSVITPYLSECSCGFFDRKFTPRRSSLEADIIKDAKLILPPDRNEELNYLSLGYGGGLQDFILIGRLIQSGYKSINITLIDPREDINALRQLKELNAMAVKYGATFKIKNYKSIDSYQETAGNNIKFHIISAIDFENILKKSVFSTVIKAHRLLHQDGRLYLSFDDFDFCFGRNNCISYLNRMIKAPFFEKAKTNLQEVCNTHYDSLHFACPSLNSYFTNWVELIPMLAKTNCKKLTLTLAEPKIIDWFGTLSDEVNTELNRDNLIYLFRLLLPTIPEIDVRFVNSFDDFKQQLQENKLPPIDIISLVGHFCKSREECNDNVDWIQQNLPNAAQLVVMNYKGGLVEHCQLSSTTPRPGR